VQKEISKGNDGFTLFGYPALVPSAPQPPKGEQKHSSPPSGDLGGVTSVELHWLPDPEQAKIVHRSGISALLAIELQPDFDWLEKDLKFSKQLKLFSSPYAGESGLKPKLIKIVKEHVLTAPATPPFTKAEYEKLREERRAIVKMGAVNILNSLEKTLAQEKENRDSLNRFMTKYNTKVFRDLGDSLKSEMLSYMEQITNGFCPYPMLLNFPRYMKAFGCRIEKAFNNTAQFRKLESQFEPFVEIMVKLIGKFDSFDPAKQEKVLAYMESVEEFAIVLFAHPTVKPLFSVSEKKLGEMVEGIEG